MRKLNFSCSAYKCKSLIRAILPCYRTFVVKMARVPDVIGELGGCCR